ncbi:MAG: hypothetical protein F6K00_23225 [Leptolyngbya sp. SIOISBB]|nr:hypothetical protein [Leptolyngbya sp. SIOISBB]
MLSACPAPTPFADANPWSLAESLDGWQRFLQSEPLNRLPELAVGEAAITVQEDAGSASVLAPILDTLHGFTGSWLLGMLLAGGSSTLVMWAFSEVVTVPSAPNCSNLPDDPLIRDQVTCWQTAITTGDTQARQQGLTEVGNWLPTNPLFGEGQDLLDQWSRAVLREAQQAEAAGDWIIGISLVAQVPHSSPHFYEARTQLARLQNHQQAQAQALNETAQAALQSADWATAYQSLEQLQALDHVAAPLDLPDQLARQISAERRAVRLWNDARWQWQAGTVPDQASAIAIAHQIDPNTYRWQTVQPQVDRWQNELLLAQTRWSQDDQSAAIASIQTTAEAPVRSPQGRDWRSLARVRPFATVKPQPQFARDLP